MLTWLYSILLWLALVACAAFITCALCGDGSNPLVLTVAGAFFACFFSPVLALNSDD